VYDNETEGCCQGTTIYNLETCCCTEAGASCNNSSEDM
jgi:hypothetical protein